MTELETMQRAKMYLDKLAQGIDPISNQEVPDDSVLNNVRLARCFFYVSGVLERVIDNGGVIGAKHEKTTFVIKPEQLSKVQISDEPIRVTQLVDALYTAVDDPNMKKMNATVITNWLLEQGFLAKVIGPDGKSRRVPTQSGYSIGLRTEVRQGQSGEYQAVFYTAPAQRFVLDHLLSILTDR